MKVVELQVAFDNKTRTGSAIEIPLREKFVADLQMIPAAALRTAERDPALLRPGHETSIERITHGLLVHALATADVLVTNVQGR